ncbi:MAG: response regulator [Planctomycetes bacterium]|nr:response regulator [Planctomycetota bacterium]NUQ34977.1 response regulator [Planctomycetaceae bacterium]
MTDANQPLVLIVEDEKAIRRFLKTSLASNGFRTIEAETAHHAIDMIQSHGPDLVILDLGLPDADGSGVIDHVRSSSQLPIIILSARDRERDKVGALDRGADDYLTKPFGVDELMARVRVALRNHARIADRDSKSALRFTTKKLSVNLETRQVKVDGEDVRLTATEYRLLATLIKHAGKVLTHRFLLREVWGPGHADEAHLVRVHMANLRNKLERDTTKPAYILTEQGVGYRLCCDDA